MITIPSWTPRPAMLYSRVRFTRPRQARPGICMPCREAFQSRVLDATIHAPWHVCATESHMFRRTV